MVLAPRRLEHSPYTTYIHSDVASNISLTGRPTAISILLDIFHSLEKDAKDMIKIYTL
jgi:hypothetical protein